MNNHNLFYEITLDICHARAPTYKWRSIPWRTKDKKTKKINANNLLKHASYKCHVSF